MNGSRPAVIAGLTRGLRLTVMRGVEVCVFEAPRVDSGPAAGVAAGAVTAGVPAAGAGVAVGAGVAPGLVAALASDRDDPPPPSCRTPLEPVALFEPPVPVPAVVPAVVPPAVACGAAFTPDAWTAPVDVPAVLPPPICAAPVEPDASFPLAAGPVGPASVTVWFAPVADAVGDAAGDDDCATPV